MTFEIQTTSGPLQINLDDVYGASFVEPGDHPHRRSIYDSLDHPTLIVLFHKGPHPYLRVNVTKDNLVECMKVLDRNPVVRDEFPKTNLAFFKLNGYWPIGIHHHGKTEVLAAYAGESDVFVTNYHYVNRHRIVSFRLEETEWSSRILTVVTFDNGAEIGAYDEPRVLMRPSIESKVLAGWPALKRDGAIAQRVFTFLLP